MTWTRRKSQLLESGLRSNNKIMNNPVKRWRKDFNVNFLKSVEMASKPVKICSGSETSSVITEWLIISLMRYHLTFSRMAEKKKPRAALNFNQDVEHLKLSDVNGGTGKVAGPLGRATWPFSGPGETFICPASRLGVPALRLCLTPPQSPYLQEWPQQRLPGGKAWEQPACRWLCKQSGTQSQTRALCLLVKDGLPITRGSEPKTRDVGGWPVCTGRANPC